MQGSNIMAYPANPPEFTDRGIKPMPAGVAVLPKAAQTRALARQISRKGIKDPAGATVYEPDEAAALALARPWLYPEQVAGQFERPQVKHVDAGELFLVRGSVLLTRLIPSPLNSRARSKLEIPPAGGDGRVAVPWGPTDLQSDPECAHRLLFAARDLNEIAASARDTAAIVEGMQSPLADMIGREGIEEDLLLAPGRWNLDSGTLASDSTVVAIDGGSRATLAQGELARAIVEILENDSALSPRRRQGLEELRAALVGRLPGLLVDDANAERDLRDQLERLLSEPADRLLRTGMYRPPRLLVAPAALVIGFRPYGEASMLDAVQQLIGNLHKRGPKQWEPAAQASDTRDEVIRSLRSTGDLSEADLYLLGPRYQEAVERFGKPQEPDYRIGEIVRLWYDTNARTGAARRATRAATRKAKLYRSALAPVLTAATLEQFTGGGDRDHVQSALNDLFANAPICPPEPIGFTSRVVDPDELVREAGIEVDAKQPGPAFAELATKGGVAMALLGALVRPFNAAKDDRPYTVLDRMMHDPAGRQLLGQAIVDLRAGRQTLVRYKPGTEEPATFLGTGEPEPWTGEALREQFPTAHQAVTRAAPTEAELVRKLSDAEKGMAATLRELELLASVQRHGISKVLAGELKVELADLAERVGHLIRRNDDFFTHEPNEGSSDVEALEDDADEDDDMALEVTT
jgi:hypothetical protein